MKRLQNILRKLHNDDSGAMSVEKVLILAVIALPIIIILLAFKGKIATWFSNREQELHE